ncbi:MAG: stealth family protein [Lachnospiraceae bacterium]|nr:stealth family protein [Lachnospiraceae bacterium]
MNEKIDIVIPWVDGSDEEWLKEKIHWYQKLNPDSGSNSNNRFQDWDNLKYLFRAIEQYMPWVNNVFFITWGHLPGFLNAECPKLRIVNHKDYIPGEYLPTFNANTIELNLCRIEELSERFIYFNDDMFPLMPIDREYYFRDGIPCDEAVETPIIPIMLGEISKFTWNMRALDISVINRNFNKREVQKKFRDKWFSESYGELLERNESLNYWDNFVGFRDPHVPSAFLKSSFTKVWEAEKETLNRACMTKFRDFSCVNQWLIRYWQLCEGNFVPRRTLGKSFTVTIDNCKDVADIIRNRGQQMICLNEDCTPEEFEAIKKEINAAFEFLLPDKCSFEK